jgi:hypothetical protein
MGGEVGNFDEHGRYQVNTLQDIEVNMHMEGNLPAFLNFFLFRGSFMLPDGKETLC